MSWRILVKLYIKTPSVTRYLLITTNSICIRNSNFIKGTVTKIEKVLINDRLRVYNVAVIYQSNLLFPEKVAYFSTVYKHNFTAQ